MWILLDIDQRGPCPVEAIRRGEVGLNYDCASFFSDVNAEINVYLPDKSVNSGLLLSETNITQ